jgi:hypothetical protein
MTDKGGIHILGGLLAMAQILVLCDAQPASAQANEGQRKAASAKMAPPVMLGWAERARIFPGNLPIQAKLDTGANTSSLNVENYQIVERDGKKWVQLTALNRANARREYELELVRVSKTKNHHGPLVLRPVVRLEICIGNIRKTAELNVSRRKGFIYKLLLGRRFLANTFTVDPSKKFTIRPNC